MLRLTIELASAEEAEQEWASHLSCGGAFVRGSDADPDRACVVVLVAPGRADLELAARTVFRGGGGVGVQLDGFGAELRARVRAWLDEAPRGGGDPPGGDDEVVPGEKAEGDGDDDDDEPAARVPRNVFERLRNLPIAQQLKLAREGELSERVALERLYGKTVWEAILRSARVTHPEVARIARMGALPRPLIELILGTTAWLRSSEIRRALLANHRLGPDQIVRVLRLLPRHELRLVPAQSAYPQPVRDAARRLLKEAL